MFSLIGSFERDKSVFKYDHICYVSPSMVTTNEVFRQIFINRRRKISVIPPKVIYSEVKFDILNAVGDRYGEAQNISAVNLDSFSIFGEYK